MNNVNHRDNRNSTMKSPWVISHVSTKLISSASGNVPTSFIRPTHSSSMCTYTQIFDTHSPVSLFKNGPASEQSTESGFNHPTQAHNQYCLIS